MTNHERKIPTKTPSNEVKDELAYCEEVITVIENETKIDYIPAVQEKLNILKEVVEDYTEQFNFSAEPDARIGHKVANSSFFVFKTHIAISDEKMITAVIVTTGKKIYKISTKPN